MPGIADLIERPHLQSLAFLAFLIVVIIMIRPKTTDTLYSLAGVIYGLFIITNVVLYFFAETTWSYFFITVGASLLFLISGYYVATFLGKTIFRASGSGETSMVFLIVMYHPPLLLIAMLIRWIIG
jgi:hypothetical protein